MAEKREKKKAPKINPGEWHAELLGPSSLHLGGTTNLSPSHPHAIELHSVDLPCRSPSSTKSLLAAVIVLMAPAGGCRSRTPLCVNEQRSRYVDQPLCHSPALLSDILSRVEGDKVKEISIYSTGRRGIEMANI